MGLPGHPIELRSLERALELALRRTEAITQLGRVRPSRRGSRPLEDEEGNENGCRRSGPDDRKMLGRPRQDAADVGAMKRAVQRRDSGIRDREEENCEEEAHGARQQGKPLSQREFRPFLPLPFQLRSPPELRYVRPPPDFGAGAPLLSKPGPFFITASLRM